MRKSMAVDVLNRIYRAKPGETVDGKYVRFFCHYEPWGIGPEDYGHDLEEYIFGIKCIFTFKDLTDDCYWRLSAILKRKKLDPDDESEYETYYEPLFAGVDLPANVFWDVIWAEANTCQSTTIENVVNYDIN